MVVECYKDVTFVERNILSSWEFCRKRHTVCENHPKEKNWIRKFLGTNDLLLKICFIYWFSLKIHFISRAKMPFPYPKSLQIRNKSRSKSSVQVYLLLLFRFIVDKMRGAFFGLEKCKKNVSQWCNWNYKCYYSGPIVEPFLYTNVPLIRLSCFQDEIPDPGTTVNALFFRCNSYNLFQLTAKLGGCMTETIERRKAL